MKDKIFRIIKKFLKKQLNDYYESRLLNEMPSIKKQIEKDSQMNKVYVNYPLKTRVIFRSNEPEPLLVGTVKGYETLHDKVYMLIEDEITGNISMPLETNLMLYTKERKQALDKLDWAEQFNVMSRNHYWISETTQKEKESKEYLSLTNNTRFVKKI